MAAAALGHHPFPREEFGDGIMSAINFRAEVERVPDPAGDRVRITLDGKFLPYQWASAQRRKRPHES